MLDPAAQRGRHFIDAMGFNLVHLRNGSLIIKPPVHPAARSELMYGVTEH